MLGSGKCGMKLYEIRAAAGLKIPRKMTARPYGATSTQRMLSDTCSGAFWT